MNLTDQPARVRQGEELDVKAVETFLKDRIPGLSGGVVVEQFPSGYSNLTYLIRIGARELVLRRPPFGRKAKTAHDMGREFRILSALQPVYPYGPRPLVYMEDETVLGSPFYVMERIRGIILRRDLPAGLEFTPDQMRTLCERLLQVHLELHSIDYRAVGLAGFGKPEGYVRRQVEGWSERYRQARTPDAPAFEQVMQWIHERMPPDSPKPAIIHNDFKLDNVVLNPENPLEIIGVLDWEMATIGDPLMDLGCSLGYWIQRDDPPDLLAVRRFPTHLPGVPTRAEVALRYAEKAGIAIDHLDFYVCFGFFRLAVIVQQIYYRFYHGQTRDERFKPLILSVQTLERAALRIVNAGGL
ncbi:MAG: phosphotransferase family protein [Thermodesulfobacteriota bacterium]